MMYKIYFTEDFKADLNKTFNYFSEELYSPAAAEKLLKEIDSRISFVSENPFMYPLCPDWLSTAGLRKIVVKNYILVYTVNEDDEIVNFVNLFYGKQNYIDFFQRID